MGMSEQQALAFVNNLMNQQAATLAANDLSWLSALLFIALIGLIWLARPIKSAARPAESAGAH
jgi:DHA2 family multidrug resistance protein